METVPIENSRATNQDMLIRAFEHLETQLDRIEGQVYKIESHLHRFEVRLVDNHGALMKESLRVMDRLNGMEAQMGLRERRGA